MTKIANHVRPGPALAVMTGAFLLFMAYYHDIYRPYFSLPDPDYVPVYNALLINDLLVQEFHDHTAYIYFLMMAVWFQLLDLFNIIPVSSLSDLTGPANFEPILESLVFAGRWFSQLEAFVFVMVMYWGLRQIVPKWHAFVAAAAMLVSPGLLENSLGLRTDLPAILFVMIAFFS